MKESINQNSSLLIEIKLERLHRRFEHLFVRRLHQVLERSDHDFNSSISEHLTKYCKHCQMHDKFFERFSFTIKDDINFNYNIIVDIMYINSKSIFHIVDEIIRFQTEK